MEVAEFFADSPEALSIYRAVESAISDIGQAEVRVSTSQVGFYREHPFAATWRPKQYLSGQHPPLVLSVYLQRYDSSSKWKEIVEPAEGRFSHHMELQSSADVDDFVRARLREAWGGAG